MKLFSVLTLAGTLVLAGSLAAQAPAPQIVHALRHGLT